MKRVLVIPVLVVWMSAVQAQTSADIALLSSARKAFPSSISSNDIVRALDAGLWNSNKTALAVSVTRPEGSSVFVFLRTSTNDYIAADASNVEVGNFGQLGSAGRIGYEKFETTPVAWLIRSDNLLQVEIRTCAWKDGKRQTVSEPLLIRRDGRVLFR